MRAVLSWRATRAAALALAATLALSAALLWRDAAARAATPPPDLVALEQQMAQLHAGSERISFQEELSLGGIVPGGAPLVLIVAGTGEASDSPAAASIVGGLFGAPTERLRLIGGTEYRYDRQAGQIDGGRSWVRSRQTAKQGSGLDVGGLLENDQAGSQGTFSKLVEELDGALSIVESGPATVDDQRVIEFDAKLDPAPYLAQLRSESTRSRHPLSSPLTSVPVGKPGPPAKPSPPPTLELEVFIAPSGLPVRARVTFSYEGATIVARIDTLAINVPVHVLAPPAGKTIGAAKLKRLERRRAARERRRALRACRHEHGKRAALCRALARAGSGARSTEITPL